MHLRSVLPMFLLVAAGLSVGATQSAAPRPTATAAAVTTGTVYVDPTCGCCRKWIAHMTGFTLATEETTALDSVPARQKVPERLRGCHTAVFGKYIVEGHVPVDVVRKLLQEQPDVVGIAVPGMPAGSPGMESATPRPYSVIAFRADGSTYEFAKR